MTAGLTWIIPSGHYQPDTIYRYRVNLDKNGTILDSVISDSFQVVKSNSYQRLPSNPQGIWAVLQAPIQGFADRNAAMIIGFILIIGGVFSVLQKTNTIDSGINTILKAYQRSPLIQKSIIPVFMLIFSLGGATFGMSEEVIPFILIFVPLAKRLGYDAMVGIAIPFVGAGAGFAGAFMNPFTIGIAQQIAGLPLFSGMGYRLISWAVCTGISILFVASYASKQKKRTRFTSDHRDHTQEKSDLINPGQVISRKHRIILALFLSGIGIMVIGVLRYQWYIEQICAIFLLMGILIGVVGRMSPGEFTSSFISGAGEMVGTAMVIAISKGILIIAQQGMIIDTVLNFFSGLITGLHPIVTSQAMFIVHTIINFFIPSGSAKAALTMPIMIPLSDLLDLSRQIAVLAYQYGDGFTNMIIPTSPVTMGVLSCAGVSWKDWARWLLPLQLIYLIIGFVMLIPPYFFNW